MVFLNELYTISNSNQNNGNAVFNIKLNPGHFIYKAHFPNEPITPGVCIIQIALELLELYLKRSLQISQVKNVKFLSVMSPKVVTDITYTFTKVCYCDDKQFVQSLVFVSGEDKQYAKISLVCK